MCKVDSLADRWSLGWPACGDMMGSFIVSGFSCISKKGVVISGLGSRPKAVPVTGNRGRVRRYQQLGTTSVTSFTVRCGTLKVEMCCKARNSTVNYVRMIMIRSAIAQVWDG